MRAGIINTYSTRIPVKSTNGFYVRWYYNGWHYWQFLSGKEIFNTEGEKYRTLGTKKITMSSGQITLNQCSAIRTIANTKEVYLYTGDGWGNIRIDPGSLQVKTNVVNDYEIELSAIIGSKQISSPARIVPIVPPVPDPDICTVTIGTQIWMCYDYDSAYPGSKVYGNNEANRSTYGGLYSISQIISNGFCPPGYHVPTIDEWRTLITFVGGSTVAGGKLKSIGDTAWMYPNTGADDAYSFGMRGGGILTPSGYAQLTESHYAWARSGDTGFVLIKMGYDTAGSIEITELDYINRYYASVRLIKDTSAPLPPLLDADGNEYHSIIVGSQEWLVENLRTTKYRDGTPIPNLTSAWDEATDGAYCWWNNDIANKENWGAYYNWFAVDKLIGGIPALPYFTRNGIEQAGWRVPSKIDVDTLAENLGGVYNEEEGSYSIAGGKLKEVGLLHWNAPNTDATDEVGFKGIGGGLTLASDWFNLQKTAGFYWTTSMNNPPFEMLPCNYEIMYDNNKMFHDSGLSFETTGMTVRCVRDI